MSPNNREVVSIKRGIVAKDDEDEKRVSRKRVTSRLATDSTSDTDEGQDFQMPADMLQQAAGPKSRH